MKFWFLLKRAFWLAHEENCFSTAKGAAYSGLLAIFPVLTSIATVLVQAKARPVLQLLGHYLSEVIPPGTEDLVLARFVVQGQKPIALLVIATALSVYAASGFMLSLMEGFDAVYHVPAGRHFLRQRLHAALLVLFASLPFAGASALIVSGARTERFVLRWVKGLPEGQELAQGFLLAGQIVRYAVVLAAVVLVTACLYYFGPHRKQRWRDVWPGAWLATFLWLAATVGFAWYVRNMANYNVMYGSIGAVIALLGWIYLLGAIAFIGCAYNAARENS
jgi:membrane protein